MADTHIVAWDIETCPMPVEAMTRAQRERYHKELARELKRDPDQDVEGASSRVRSLHPHLAWICCISAIRGSLCGRRGAARSWTCSEPSGEGDLVRDFWAAIAGFPASTTWVTFNGKSFDVPVLLARSVHHGVEPTQRRLLDTYPYRHRPHADLACVWRYKFNLDGLCDLLGVPSPKGGMCGADVAGAVEAGAISEVARYCEADVAATLACMGRLGHTIWA